MAAQAVDLRQLICQRLGPERLYGLGVHECGVHVADFLFQRALGSIATGGIMQNIEHIQFSGFTQFVKAAPARAIRRNRVLFHPATVDVLEKVILRPHTAIHVVQIDTQPQRLRVADWRLSRGRLCGGRLSRLLGWRILFRCALAQQDCHGCHWQQHGCDAAIGKRRGKG